ncbi:MAG: hypothetical protein ACOYLE_06880 [Bacteroidales bacterium]
MEELKNLEEIKNYLKSIEHFKKNVNCEKNSDDYVVNIQSYTESTNNEEMIVYKTVQSSISINIHIDSNKLFEAYCNLKEDEKIPSQHNIVNPCIEENYLNFMLEHKYLKIMENLKMFNGETDDYYAIARLIGISRGYVLGKRVGI